MFSNNERLRYWDRVLRSDNLILVSNWYRVSMDRSHNYSHGLGYWEKSMRDRNKKDRNEQNFTGQRGTINKDKGQRLRLQNRM